MNSKQETSQIAEEIAEETYKQVASKFRIVTDLEIRVKRLEDIVKEHVDNFKVVAIETERMITEKYNELVRQQDESVTMLVSDIQDLRDEIIALKNKLKSTV
ncbi:MAG: hypothetical protein ACE5J4_02220 [Candidatus Aenigmatarchaeota archaeon]